MTNEHDIYYTQYIIIGTYLFVVDRIIGEIVGQKFVFALFILANQLFCPLPSGFTVLRHCFRYLQRFLIH